MKVFDIIQTPSKEMLAESARAKVSKIIHAIKTGDAPDNIINNLKNFVTNLISGAPQTFTGNQPEQTPTDQLDEPQPVAVEPQAQAQPVAVEPQAQPVAVEPEEEPALQEAKPKKSVTVTQPIIRKDTISSAELEIYELLKRLSPEDADITWAFYNRQMIEYWVHLMCDEKDVPKIDDKDRVTNLFVKSPGLLEDKVTLVKTIYEKGVINPKAMLKPGYGSINKFFTYSSPTLDAVKEKLIWMRVTPSTTSANTGDGEAFFLLLCKGAAKLSPGDLNVLGREIEIKAQGARLKGFGGKGIYGDGTSYYSKFNLDLNNILGNKGIQYLSEMLGYNKKTGKSEWDISKPLNFGLTNLGALSETLKLFGKGKSSDVKTMFENAIKHIFTRSTPEMRQIVKDVIGRDGSFDVTEFRQAWFMLTYEYYNLTSINTKTGEGFAGILFVHQPSFTYNFVINGDQIKDNWDKFEIGSGLYTWTDMPSVVPKITFGKEIRLKE